MSTHNIRFCGELRKISILLFEEIVLHVSGAMLTEKVLIRLLGSTG